MFEEEYRLEFFQEAGYSRRVCESCGSPFWTMTDRGTCGDAPCEPFTFIGDPLIEGDFTLDSMRDRFLSFFENRGHARLSRYPIIPRWRQDVFLVSASIYDFQPHVTSGIAEPPANPLTISQPCIRMDDLDSVGRTSKHLSGFEMMAHHAFHSDEHPVYWKEETVAYCHEFLTADLKIPAEGVTYKEHPWAGGGNAGPSFEVVAGGLELATLVFMNLQRDDSGPVEVEGGRYSPMKINVVDTGYGLERFLWASKGSPSICDAVYPDLCQRMYEDVGVADLIGEEGYRRALQVKAALGGSVDVGTAAKVQALRENLLARLKEAGTEVDPEGLNRLLDSVERVHLAVDHTRSVAFMLADGVVPSNVKTGYLARLILRRVLRALEALDASIGIEDLVLSHIERYADLLDAPNRDTILEILGSEKEKYAAAREKGRRLVHDALSKGSISTEDLVTLYDAHGVHPSQVLAYASETGARVSVPDDFYALLARRHERADVEPETVARADLPPTRTLYYEDQTLLEFDAKAVHVEGSSVVLDRTAFYPEGGGQPADHGVLRADGREFEVVDVQKVGRAIVHTLKEGTLPQGAAVHGEVDGERRAALMRAHTGTHVLLRACRRVLGDHVWQAGARKGVEISRLDISHYRRVTPEELAAIERMANRAIMDGLTVTPVEMDRGEAEREFGFQLYQGGIPPSKTLRVVKIDDYDVQGCGGTHLGNTREIGPLKIVRATSIQDGVERLEFAVGMPAVEAIQEQERLLRGASEALRVSPEQLPATARRFFDEWKSLRKRLEAIDTEKAGGTVDDLLPTAQEVGGVRVVAAVLDENVMALRKLARRFSRVDRVVAVLGSSKDGALVAVSGGDVDVDCVEMINAGSRILGGKGGGTVGFAQGGGPEKDRIKEAVEAAKNVAREALQA
jgi:alanyl-tRNA synthetase